MKKYSSNGSLNLYAVLNVIPDEWTLASEKEGYNMVMYLSSMFDNLYTLEENTEISSNLTN